MNDDIDAKILTMLQDDARVSNAEIARRLSMAPSAVLERVRKLEARGAILGYETRVNPRAVNAGFLAFIFVRTESICGDNAVGSALAAIPETQEVHNVAGEDCYLVKARVADPEALGRLLRERIGVIPSVRSTRSTIVLETLKETSRLPLAESAAESVNDGESEARYVRH
jgi:Lrp/AsnC family transcriptional regulator, leucine-responsive regulatory protein